MELLLILNPYTMNSAFINLLVSFILNWLGFVIQCFFENLMEVIFILSMFILEGNCLLALSP